jgi:hypothetical protein
MSQRGEQSREDNIAMTHGVVGGRFVLRSVGDGRSDFLDGRKCRICNEGCEAAHHFSKASV